MFIENCSMANVERGFHYDAGDRGILIQITDPLHPPPKPCRPFAEVHHFEFLDAEGDEPEAYPDEALISMQQARAIAALLVRAKNERRNVIVHCHAGICRSGAVVEVGTMIGFQDPEKYRQPNLRVKRFLVDAMYELGAFE